MVLVAELRSEVAVARSWKNAVRENVGGATRVHLTVSRKSYGFERADECLVRLLYRLVFLLKMMQLASMVCSLSRHLVCCLLA